MDEPTYAATARTLRAARSVVIGSHVDPDGDAIGSALGLGLALETLGVDVTLVLADRAEAPSTYAFLPSSQRLRGADGIASPEVFVALDSPELRRLGDAESIARTAGTLVVIDHHPDGDGAGDVRLVDSTAAATGELVWRLLAHLGVTPDARIAECLYAALLSDTGRFSYTNTTPEALRAAADMVATGVEPNRVYAEIYERRSAGAQALIALVLGRITVLNGGRVAYSWIGSSDFEVTGALPEESENLIDHVRALDGVDIVFLAKVIGESVRVSLRAKTSFDVGAVARMLGGGGHQAAAGFTFDGSLTSLLERLLPLLPGAAR